MAGQTKESPEDWLITRDTGRHETHVWKHGDFQTTVTPRAICQLPAATLHGFKVAASTLQLCLTEYSNPAGGYICLTHLICKSPQVQCHHKHAFLIRLRLLLLLLLGHRKLREAAPSSTNAVLFCFCCPFVLHSSLLMLLLMLVHIVASSLCVSLRCPMALSSSVIASLKTRLSDCAAVNAALPTDGPSEHQGVLGCCCTARVCLGLLGTAWFCYAAAASTISLQAETRFCCLSAVVVVAKPLVCCGGICQSPAA